MKNQIHALILAAGTSRRLGHPKQLVSFQGKSLLCRAAQFAQSCCPSRVSIVLGANREKLQQELEGMPVQILFNDQWEEGLASSIRLGIQSLPNTCQAVLILLCDQPLLQEVHLQQLLEASMLNPTQLIASQYEQTLGVPAVIPREYFPDLVQLKGDRGAKKVFQKHINQVVAVELPEAALDIDTPTDLEKLQRIESYKELNPTKN